MMYIATLTEAQQIVNGLKCEMNAGMMHDEGREARHVDAGSSCTHPFISQDAFQGVRLHQKIVSDGVLCDVLRRVSSQDMQHRIARRM